MLSSYLFHQASAFAQGTTPITLASTLRASGGVLYNLGTQLSGGTSVNFSLLIGTGTTDASNGRPIIVGADFSCWSPDLGRFILPEDTNLMLKVRE